MNCQYTVFDEKNRKQHIFLTHPVDEIARKILRQHTDFNRPPKSDTKKPPKLVQNPVVEIEISFCYENRPHRNLFDAPFLYLPADNFQIEKPTSLFPAYSSSPEHEEEKGFNRRHIFADKQNTEPIEPPSTYPNEELTRNRTPPSIEELTIPFNPLWRRDSNGKITKNEFLSPLSLSYSRRTCKTYTSTGGGPAAPVQKKE